MRWRRPPERSNPQGSGGGQALATPGSFLFLTGVREQAKRLAPLLEWQSRAIKWLEVLEYKKV